MYNRIKAVEYAKKWAFKYNPSFYDFSKLGGDCTNFISQCLFAGGIKMNFSTNGWYYKSLNDRAPAWTGVNEFWNFGVNNDQSNDFVGGFTLIPCSQNELEAGDVIQLYNGVKYYHTLLVTGVDGRITVSAHDNDSFNVPLVAYKYKSLRCARVMDKMV